jgi:hypothetical protein
MHIGKPIAKKIQKNHKLPQTVLNLIYDAVYRELRMYKNGDVYFL